MNRELIKQVALEVNETLNALPLMDVTLLSTQQ